MASDNWSGFTDEDIERIKTKSNFPSNKECNLINNNDVKEKAGPLKIKQEALKKIEYKTSFPASTNRSSSDSDVELDEKPFRLKKNSKFKEFPPQNPEIYVSTNSINSPYPKSGTDVSDDSCASIEAKKENCDQMTNSNASLNELELFEVRQKRIEAENVRRRALINKAITDKKMQTQAESVKLAKITQELKHLDSILSEDVSILRNYIEKASFEFSEAEKRYLKAERDFIEAKLHLFDKMQRKEQLTEHLCAIIEQNENRKANKLVELMKQLEMEALVEECGIEQHEPILSKFCILNDEKYHHCQTLRPTSSCVEDSSSNGDFNELSTASESNATQDQAKDDSATQEDVSNSVRGHSES